jgi:hypothetical protein
MSLTYAQMEAELKWLKDNPHFEERPATIEEFLGPDYLNIEGLVRAAIMEELKTIVGDSVDPHSLTAYQLAMITGGIGIGKTTVASIVLPYLAHWVLCLKDPQRYFKLLPGSRIAFMQMSTSAQQAKEVVFGDVKARIEYSPWFQNKYPYDRNFKNQLRFPKDIWILPGDSKETTFEGYNILGGILDEADSHQVTENKDYAEQGYTTIYTRVTSRFGNRGFLLVIGQMKKANGFAARKYEEFRRDPNAHAVRMAIWESMGWENYLKPDGTRDSFWYDSKRKEIIPPGVVDVLPPDKTEHLIEVPEAFRRDFENNPEKALRDLAGIPPATGDPFISLVYRIEDARNRWIARHADAETGQKIKSPVNDQGQVEKWFMAPDSLKRVVHIDMAFSGDGDALGLAMGHVNGMMETEDGEKKPYIIIDLLLRVHAPAGREIYLGDIRRIIYDLRDGRHFKITKVTMDGFQSTDSRQQFQRRRMESEIVSIDKTLVPYYDLREAIYEDRIEFPQLMVRLRHEDMHMTEIALKELMELVDNGAKIDHPPDGSKDVADAMAGVVYTLMGDRRYHRRVVQGGVPGQSATRQDPASPYHPVLGDLGLRAPLPPADKGATLWDPRRLR